MKLHWGNALFLFFVAYIGALGFILYQSTQVDHSLVADDYYAQDLAYQKQYEKLTNYARSEAPLSLDYEADKKQIFLVSPPEGKEKVGIITFYHPSRSDEDIEQRFSVKGGDRFSFSVEHLPSGRWIAQVDYSDAMRAYYFEKEIFVR